MRLLLADPDTAYVTMLAKAVRESDWGRKISVSVVTNPASEWVFEQIGEYDAVIVNPEHQHLFLNEEEDRFVMFWSEEPEKNNGIEDDAVPRIYKYQPVHQLVMEVMEAYSLRHGERNVRRPWHAGEGRVIAVYAASGGAGATTFARGLSELLAAAGYRTFYLNMECIPSYAAPGQGSKKFGQVLYHLRRGEAAQLRSMIIRDTDRDYDMLPTADYYKEWREFTSEEIQQLIQFLRELKRYDCLILDLECALSEQTIAALQLCDDLLWLRKDELISQYKTDFVRRELGFLMPDKLEQVCTPVQLKRELTGAFPPSLYAPYLQLLGLEGKDSLA